MHNVIILNSFGVDDADRFADGVTDYGIDVNNLETITAIMKSGIAVERKAGTNIVNDVGTLQDQTFTLVANTVNGIVKGITINPKNLRWSVLASDANTSQVQITKLAALPWDGIDLEPFIGQYASISITDLSMPEYNTKRTKVFTTEIITGDDHDSVMGRLEDLIGAWDKVDTAVYAADELTITFKTTGRYSIQGGDLFRGIVVTNTQEPIRFTVSTSQLLEEEYRRSSQMGVNIHKMASDLHSVQSGVEADQSYTVFTIESVNNIGKDKGHQFPVTQLLAVDERQANLILEITSFLEYISGEDAAATWEDDAT